MISPSILFFCTLCLFFLGMLLVVRVTWQRTRSLAGTPTLEALLARLQAVDRQGVALIAAEFEASGDQDGRMESWQVWEMIGGMPGLEALAANCEVLIDLASYVQRWYPEALPVAEHLRLSAREVQWHLDRLHGAASRGHLQTAIPDYAQRAVALYYGMTQNVLSLYRVSQVPGSALLLAVL